jgi:hypothetical protein
VEIWDLHLVNLRRIEPMKAEQARLRGGYAALAMQVITANAREIMCVTAMTLLIKAKLCNNSNDRTKIKRIAVLWDNGSNLSLIDGVDQFIKVA